MKAALNMLSKVFLTIIIAGTTATSVSATPYINCSLSKIVAPAGLPRDQFGYAVSVSPSGKYLAVGAPGYDYTWATGGPDVGAVYVYQRNQYGGWGLMEKLRPYRGVERGCRLAFGVSVAICDSGLIVGAVNVGRTKNVQKGWGKHKPIVMGRAYVFRRYGSAYGIPDQLDPCVGIGGPCYTPPSSLKIVSSALGFSVDITADGKTCVVGAPSEVMRRQRIDSYADSSYSAAYFFDYEPVTGRWSRFKETHDYRNLFGYSVAVSPDGKYVAVTAPGEFRQSVNLPYFNSVTYGSCRFYSRYLDTYSYKYYYTYAGLLYPRGETPAGPFIEDVPPGALVEHMGVDVDLSNNLWAAISAPNFMTQTGRAYLYEGTSPPGAAAPKWGNPFQFSPTSLEATRISQPVYGISLAFSPYSENYHCDLLAVGCPDYGTFSGQTNPGAVFLYARGGGSWGEVNPLSLTGAPPEDEFGFSVSLADNGSVLAIGDPTDKGKTHNEAGAVYLAEPLAAPSPTPHPEPWLIELNYGHFENICAFVCPLLFNPWDPEPIPYRTAEKIASLDEEIHVRMAEIESEENEAVERREEVREEALDRILEIFQEEESPAIFPEAAEKFGALVQIIELEKAARTAAAEGDQEQAELLRREEEELGTIR